MGISLRLRRSVLVATVLLAAGTVVLATVPPRPLRSALTVVHALSFRVAGYWLAVVALLAVAERLVSAGRIIDRRGVRRLAAAVFVGALAIEASPLLRLVVTSEALDATVLVRRVAASVQGALFPAGLFAAAALGTLTIRDTELGRAGRVGLPLVPTAGMRPAIGRTAAGAAGRALALVAVAWFGVALVARLVTGDPYVWLALADAGVGALGGFVEHAVIAVAFLALVADGVTLRSIAAGAAGVWLGVFGLGLVVTLFGALLAVALVSFTTTPMGAVEASGLATWPAPDSWALLLRIGAFVAGAVGLLAIQRTTGRARDPPAAADPGDRATADRR